MQRARLEDLVVDKEYRGLKLSILLIETVKKLCQHLKCYKVTLDCNDDLMPFYKRLGFIAEPNRSNFLTIRF